MYFVDRQKIERILQYLEQQLALYRKYSDWEDERSSLALERIIHTSIDSVLDVGNAIIDGFIMRDPGSFEDIIDILLDEKVINEDIEQQFKQILPLRKMLIQDYLDSNKPEIFSIFKENIEAFTKYPELIRGYLVNELGSVTAFKN